MLALAFLSANIWKYIPNEKNKPIGTKKYKELNDEELDKNLAVYLMCKMMGDRNMCGWTMNTVDKMLESNKLEFFKEFELYMVKNKDTKLLKNN